MAGVSTVEVATQVPFYDLCALLEKIASTTGTEKKKKILEFFVNSWREAHAKLHGTSKTAEYICCIDGLLLTHFTLVCACCCLILTKNEVVLAKYYIEILSIGKDSTDGRKLLNYRAPKNAKQDSVADFASVAYFVLRNRCPEKGSLKIDQVNKYLDQLASANIDHKRDEAKKALQLLLRNTSALEQKWLIRIIFKELKIGLSENSVFNVYHPDAMELFGVCNSLPKVCMDLHDRSIRMNEAEMSLFSPFRPMLAERKHINEASKSVEKVMNNQSFYIETKIDGERMQLHKDKDSFMYFSRSANEYTHVFGGDPSSGVLTPHIAGCFSSSVHSCILDGEMVVVDPKTDTWLSKGMNVDVKSLTAYENDEGHHPCFIVFDILIINEKKLANLDLVIVGGYFGVGRRSGMTSHFMCAVAVPSNVPGEHPKVFHSFCKVGSGYTINELRELDQQLRPHWNAFDTKKPPESIILAPGFKFYGCCSPALVIPEPQLGQSWALLFKTGVTLRFPRLEAVRSDKMWYECLNLNELTRLKSVAEGKLTYQHVNAEEKSEPAKKRRREAVRVEQSRTVAKHFKPADVSSVEEVSQMFQEKEFYIVNGPSSHPKAVLEKKVAENGGTLTQNPCSDTLCVVAERINVRVKNIISQDKYDVVKASWLINCLDSGELKPWIPSDMFHSSSRTADKFAEEFDRHGDSYTEFATAESLRKAFDNVQSKNSAVPLSTDEILEISQRYFPDNSPFGLFKHCRVYLDQFIIIGNKSTGIPNSSLELIGLKLRMFGARITDSFDSKVTHVVFDERDLCRLKELQRVTQDREVKQHLVTLDWVTQSIQAEKLLPERHFRPVT
ncbi:hypothetical protein pdam_00006836 [Pocillopora damicornis]|uniref:DNA ligase IV n=1 Tax=Pocillopora damicornis TaxID=46731 RepID=A0A3M6TNW6_POCDA|nr:hypothetical protein pdam_00006836 [Pocillopora damicornis]